MSVPQTVTDYLRASGVDFHVITHAPSADSAHTAHAAHVPGEQLAKAVVLDDGVDYVLAVLPSTHRLDPAAMAQMLHRWVKLVPESDFPILFRDCRPGAVPPLGEPYGLRMIVDDAMTAPAEVYLEAGDHEHLIQLGHAAFCDLIERAERGRISYHA